MLLGIIGAMEKETDALISQMEDTEETVTAGIRYVTGTLMGRKVVLSRCGIGKVHAAMCAVGMIERYHPDAVLNIGVAGGLLPELHIGDIVVAQNAVQHDADTSALGDPVGYVSGLPGVYMPADGALAEKILLAAREEGLACVQANITTGDQFIDSLDKKRYLASQFGAGACDMEGGAVAQVCLESGTPYAAFRAISDTLTGNGKEYEENVLAACAASARLLKRLLTAADWSGISD